MNAVLVCDGISSKKHSSVISEFRKRYIKTGIFDKSFSTIIGNAFDVRISSDYDVSYIIAKGEVIQQVGNAKTFLSAVKEYISTF